MVCKRVQGAERSVSMFKSILVPLDGSPLAECVLPHVVAMALPLGFLLWKGK